MIIALRRRGFGLYSREDEKSQRLREALALCIRWFGL